MPKTTQSPGSVLRALLDEYQIAPFALSKAISLSNSAVLQILKGKSKITVPTALRLAKFFGQSPSYWLDLQLESDLDEAVKDKDLEAVLKGIVKAKKPDAKPKAEPKAKPAKKTTASDKSKEAVKETDAKPAKRKRSQAK